MTKRKWEQALADSLKLKVAQRWIKEQNKREADRAAAREATGIVTNHATVAWTDVPKLTVQQKNQLELMMAAGWQVYGIVASLEDQCQAVACKHRDGTHGVLYPSGELDRGSRWTWRRVDMWSAYVAPLKTRAVAKVSKPKFVPRRSPDQFPSNAVKISRYGSD